MCRIIFEGKRQKLSVTSVHLQPWLLHFPECISTSFSQKEWLNSLRLLVVFMCIWGTRWEAVLNSQKKKVFSQNIFPRLRLKTSWSQGKMWRIRNKGKRKVWRGWSSESYTEKWNSTDPYFKGTVCNIHCPFKINANMLMFSWCNV